MKRQEIDLGEKQKQEIDELKNELIEYFEGANEDTVATQLRQTDPLDILDKDVEKSLRDAVNKDKFQKWIDDLVQQVERHVADTNDSVTLGESYEPDPERNKTEIAIEMADHAASRYKVRPVDKGVNRAMTELYKYDSDQNIWRPFPRNRTLPLCKAMAGRLFSSHLHNEFKKNLAGHEMRQHFEVMGLPKNEILLKDGVVLDINNLPEKNMDALDTREVKSDDLALHIINANYDPTATCPKFKDFVSTLLDGREKQIDTLQEYMGYLLSFPDDRWQKALLILGVSNSGKSQLAEMVEHLFSNHSVSNISFPQLGYQRRFHVGKLDGKIVNIEKDLSKQEIDDLSVLKQVISQERLLYEEKGEDTYEVKPNAKHIVCANVTPRIGQENDDAFYNRFLTLKAPNEVAREDRVNNLGEKLAREEADGILNWMLKGLERLEKQGEFTLQPTPEETRIMWNEYGDPIQRFLWKSCKVTGDSDDIISTKELYEWYEKWAKNNGHFKHDQYNFNEKVTGQPRVKKDRRMVNGQSRKRCFVGLKFDEDAVMGEL